METLDNSGRAKARELVSVDALFECGTPSKHAEVRCAETRQQGCRLFFWHPIPLCTTDGQMVAVVGRE
jgi:hypothetical protein